MTDLEFQALLEDTKGRFTHAGPLDAGTLRFLPEVRDMCAEGKCRAYGHSWSCPPAVASLEEMAQRIRGYRRGILMQTVGQLEDSFDVEGMAETQERHKQALEQFTRDLLARVPRALVMGAGSCTRCEVCTYPDAPCRFPELVHPSMEDCGLLVSEVCTKNAMAYNHGPNTITLVSCCLTD